MDKDENESSDAGGCAPRDDVPGPPPPPPPRPPWDVDGRMSPLKVKVKPNKVGRRRWSDGRPPTGREKKVSRVGRKGVESGPTVGRVPERVPGGDGPVMAGADYMSTIVLVRERGPSQSPRRRVPLHLGDAHAHAHAHDRSGRSGRSPMMGPTIFGDFYRPRAVGG